MASKQQTPTLHLRIDEQTYKLLTNRAAKEQRTMATVAKTALKHGLAPPHEK